MLNCVHFFRVPVIVCIWVVCMFHTINAFACTANEITLPNGDCVPAKFTMTVGGFPQSSDDFIFYVAAIGTLYVDWHNGKYKRYERQ